ncbi:hypothetical protein BGP79_09045 [Tersicoccus sp. Bi-70]|nr:hypothetical protein BGP79_09045 [Tersicoccus sp. Bi-70]
MPSSWGALGDGTHDDTVPIQRAIDDCAARGGGTVRLTGPDRTWVTGPIQLRSHITLQIDDGATLRAVADRSRFTWGFVGYTFNQSAAGNPDVAEALVSGRGVTDVAITGGGTIDGQGSQLWWTEAQQAKTDISRYKSALTFGALAAAIEADPAHPSALPASRYAALGAIPTSNGLPRPWVVEFYDAQRVSVSDATVTNCSMWCLGLRYTTDAAVTGLTVRNPSDAPNTDGVDVVSSDRVRLSRLDIATGDDDVAIKSGFPGFATPAVPATDITVTDSVFGTGHGLSIGSEADNGVRDVRGSHLTFTGTDNGVRIKSGRDRGSDIGEIAFEHVRMTDVASPITFTDYYTGLPKPGVDTGRPVTATTPHIHDVTVRDLQATGAQKSQLIGLPEAPLQRIDLSGVLLQGTALELRNVTGAFHGVRVQPTTGSPYLVEEGVAVTGLRATT